MSCGKVQYKCNGLLPVIVLLVIDITAFTRYIGMMCNLAPYIPALIVLHVVQ